MSSEVTAELIEEVFGKHSDSVRFANFCNALVIAETSAGFPTLPTLSEKPGADGGMDGEWTIPINLSEAFKSPFGLPGWNVFQYKARGIGGNGRRQAFTTLCSDLKGALESLVSRLPQGKECCQYSLFTNLQLGLETTPRTSDGKLLHKHRSQLTNAIAGSQGKPSVSIFDATLLAAIVNAHPALRLTYFSGPNARPWDDAWAAEQRVKDYKVSVPLIGRNQELRQLGEWLNEPNTKVIVICGLTGMGKTRLALEATRVFAHSTTIVDVVDDLLRTDFQALGTSKTTRFIIVEDPTREQAEALAKRAVACEGLKLILTVPTATKAPALKLTEHQAIKILPPLQPLSNSDAENLLKSAGASPDRQALDWILLQAGGNPEILLSAADLKNELREKSGDLKNGLNLRFRAKIETELGLDGIRALKTLSPILYVNFSSENSELKCICDSISLGIQPSRVREVLPDLERMGYIRRRGNYVCVVPPLFAARLVEELAETHDHGMRVLFNALGEASRGRFLERMVTVDLPEQSTFWDFMFGENGPILKASRMANGFDHIDCLARAVPARTANFLESQLNNKSGDIWKGSELASTLRELVYEGESCTSGMRCLELLALKEISEMKQSKINKLFCECFVDWNHDFPMSCQERVAWIERLVKSEITSRRLLGAHVVAFVTAPPQMLSGYFSAARRLGQPPPRRIWKEIFDYVTRLVALRFELTQSEDKGIAEVARNAFEEAISQLMGHVSQEQLVTIIEQLVEWNFNGKLTSDVRKIRSAIHWVESKYKDGSQGTGQEEFRDKWDAVLRRLAILRERFDSGEFLIRLQIATGRAFEHDWELGAEGRVYGYQKRLRALASEAVSDPNLMTEAAWTVLRGKNSHQAGEFVQFMGECDKQKQFLARFESEAGERTGNWRFGLYCLGLYRSDPAYVENYFDRLVKKPAFSRAILLWPIRFIGPTPTNRNLLAQFIESKSVSPAEVANMFTAGRWLDSLPPSEVVTIMDFIAQGDDWPELAAEVMSLYLHPKGTLPQELIPFARRILQEIEATLDNSYDCNHIALGIAKTDLEKGFALLNEHIATLHGEDWRMWRGKWNAFQRHGGHEFWDYLVSQDPERAYRYFCAVKDPQVRNEICEYSERPLLDTETHGSVLLKIANESEGDAEEIAASISIVHSGFFPFAFELLRNRPIDGRLAANLSSTIVERFGFGSPLDKLQIALSQVESQLKQKEILNHERAWLEGLKYKILEAIKISPWKRDEQQFLGWS